MTTSKIQPPRKLTEDEDLDSFDDWWFQCISYFGRDENFKYFFETADLQWESKSVQNRGLTTALQSANLTCLLRAFATYAVGPYIKTNIVDKTKSLEDVRNEFLKFLEIEVNDFTSLNWYDIQRKPTERPLVFYYRLRYHMSKHLVKRNANYQGTLLARDEQIGPSLDRFIVMEWLYRLDKRLVKYIQEKFSTELNASSTALVNMVETLAKNVDSYISRLNSSNAAIGAVRDLSFQQEDGSDNENNAMIAF